MGERSPGPFQDEFLCTCACGHMHCASVCKRVSVSPSVSAYSCVHTSVWVGVQIWGCVCSYRYLGAGAEPHL
jgi:hypothetical protein